MKIISKYKDYYDYLQGIYGVDNKLVLDRRDSIKISSHPEKSKCVFHIGEWCIEGLWWDGKLYFGKEIEPFVFKRKYAQPKEDKDNYVVNLASSLRFYRTTNIAKKPIYLGDDSPTWEENCPLLYSPNGNKDYIKNPLLSAFNIHRVYTAEEVWLILSEWLGKKITKNEPEVPVGDDKVRIQQAGFDLKTSFRKC